MNIYYARQLLRQGVSIYEMDLRVGYYARVSTDKEEQKNSIDNQQAYFGDLIKKYPRWTFVKAYVDDGISGLHTDKRENFNYMLNDAKNNCVDLILTKEISRFARNTLDSIMYTRQMLNYGTCVWFLNDNINTIDEDSELRLTIMSGIAQDEVRKLSSRVKFGHAQSIKKGVVLGNSLFYGYDKKNGKLTINESEAEMIRIIFELYSTGEWSTGKLENHLYNLGYRNHKGGKISNVTIQHILQNPKYKGYYCGGKVKIVDMFTKKQEFLPESDWTMFKDEDGENVPAIVSEKIWDKCNSIYKARSKIVKEKKTSMKTDNLLTGKIFCGIDGAAYWLKSRTHRGKQDLKWRCSHKINNGADSCKSFSVDENEIRFMLADILNQKFGDFSEEIDQYINMYKKLLNPNCNNNEEKIKVLKRRLEVEEQKKDKLLDCLLSNILTKEEFTIKNNKILHEIEQIKSELESLEIKPIDENLFQNSIDKIRKMLEKYSGVTPQLVDKKLVNELIDKIIVVPTSENEADIRFILNGSDEQLWRLARQDVCRSGNMIKNSKNPETRINRGFFMCCSDNMMLKILPERHTVFSRNLRSCFNHEFTITYRYSIFF